MATTIYHAVNLFTADGAQTEWDFQFDGVIPDTRSGTTPYLYAKDVKVQEMYTEADGTTVTIQRDVQLIGPATIRVLGEPVARNRTVRIYRETEVRFPLVDYRDRQVVTEADLDLQARQTLFAVMEVTDVANRALEVARDAEVTSIAGAADAAEALRIAEIADGKSDSALDIAGRANQTSGQAKLLAEQALEAANLAEEHATQVELLAEQSSQAAAAAAQSAADAKANSDYAIEVAEGIDAKAEQAIQTANTAKATADQAKQTAEAIDAKASEALSTANTAKSTADTAKGTADTALSTANAIDAKATEALETANLAKSTAEAAKSTADAVDGKAQAALDKAGVNATAITGLQEGLEIGTAMITKLQRDVAYKVPTQISHLLHGAAIVLVDGQLYSSMGGTASSQIVTVAAGRGLSSGHFGMGNFARIPLPTTSKVVKFGGTYDVVALCENGELYGWGLNANGALGLGNSPQIWNPILCATGVLDLYTTPSNAGVAPDQARTVIKKADGIYGAGFDAFGQLGVAPNGSNIKPSFIKIWDYASRPVKKIWNLGAGYGCMFIQTMDDHLWATGYNFFGNLGTGAFADVSYPFLDVTAAWGGVSEIAKLVDIHGGFGFGPLVDAGTSVSICVAHFTDKVRVCGSNSHGQLGIGAVAQSKIAAPAVVPLPTGVPVKQVTIHGGGAASVHALLADGRVFGWGHNYNNSVGSGPTATVVENVARQCAFPVLIDKILSVGYDRMTYSYISNAFFLARPVDGAQSVWATGYGAQGGRGSGNNSEDKSPTRTLFPMLNPDGTVLKVTSIGVNISRSLDSGTVSFYGFTEQGHLYTWGDNVTNACSTSVSAAYYAIPTSVPCPWHKENTA